MNAKFWLFNKKENSTSTPGGNGTPLTIRLKERVDIDNPVFICQTNVMNYNYMQFDGSYYFIRRKTYIANSLFEIEARRDALATYKSEIKSSTQYVDRTNVESVINPSIFDIKYPLTVKPQVYRNFFTENPLFDWSNPTVLLTVKGKTGSKIYATNLGSLNLIASSLYQADSQKTIWDALQDLPDAFTKTYLDAFSFITDCRLIPVAFDMNGAVTSIYLGTTKFEDVASAFKDVTNMASISRTPYYLAYALTGVDSKKKFLLSNKARTVSVYLPGVGEISLDVEKTYDIIDPTSYASGVTVNVTIDNRGHVAYEVSSGKETQYASTDISIPIALYSNIENVGGVISSVAKVIGATTAGYITGGVPGLVGGLATGSISAIASASPLYKGSTLGSDGSKASIENAPYLELHETQYDITEQAPGVFGYPCCKSVTLSSNGYYLISNPVIDFGDDLVVKETIKEHMRNGFYIE